MYRISIPKKDIEKIESQIAENRLFKTRKSYINYLCELICNGEFDDLYSDENKVGKVYGDKEIIQQARKHAQEIGYGTLQEMLSDVLSYIENGEGKESDTL